MNITEHADAILRASGSSLRNYTMPGNREAILAACQALHDEGVRAGIEAAALMAAGSFNGPDAHDRIRAIDIAKLGEVK